MTALEYMEKQVQKHRQDYIREYSRFAPQKMLDNILMKVNYYELACEALRNATKGGEIDFDYEAEDC